MRSIALAAVAIALVAAGAYLWREAGSDRAVAPSDAAAPRSQSSAAQPAHPALATAPAPRDADAAVAADEPSDAGPIDPAVAQATAAYERQDYSEAKEIARRTLAASPSNVAMLRIMVAASCVDGDVTGAEPYYRQLPKRDRDELRVQCNRFGVAMPD